jgi:hypothetical protein
MSRAVFVTVGTTKFDALIAAVDTPAVAEALSSHGYDRLVMQVCARGLRGQTLMPSLWMEHGPWRRARLPQLLAVLCPARAWQACLSQQQSGWRIVHFAQAPSASVTSAPWLLALVCRWAQALTSRKCCARPDSRATACPAAWRCMFAHLALSLIRRTLPNSYAVHHIAVCCREVGCWSHVRMLALACASAGGVVRLRSWAGRPHLPRGPGHQPCGGQCSECRCNLCLASCLGC